MLGIRSEIWRRRGRTFCVRGSKCQGGPRNTRMQCSGINGMNAMLGIKSETWRQCGRTFCVRGRECQGGPRKIWMQYIKVDGTNAMLCIRSGGCASASKPSA